MMSIQDWLTIAKKLPVGGSTRMSCCNQNQTAILSHSSKWYRVHCFRCGFTATQKKECLTLAELAKMNEAEDKYKKWAIPPDACREFPQAERVWLMENGGTIPGNSDIMYSPSLKRIIIPVYSDWFAGCTGSQARSVHCKPKYLTAGNAAVSCHGRGLSVLVLTEDILSARRVAECVRVGAIALIGTHLTDAAIRAIVQYPGKYDNITVWMDPDEAGQKASEKITGRLIALGLTDLVINVVSSADPKKCTTREIRMYLNGD